MNEKLIIAVIGILGTLAGVFIGGLITFLNSYFQAVSQNERERNKTILSKLEETHTVVIEFKEAYKEAFVGLLQVAGGIISTAELKDKLKHIPMQRLEMLISFYAPELENQLIQLQKAQTNFGEVMTKALMSNLPVKKETAVGLEDAWMNLQGECSSIQSELAKISKKHL